MIKKLLPLLLASSFVAILNASSANAIDIDMFSHNDIIFYDDCTNSDDDDSCEEVSGEDITWIGDSYSNGNTKIEEKFPGVDIHAMDCKRVATTFNQKCGGSSGENKSGLKIAEELVKDGKMRKYLVFALGTNDSGDMSKSIKKLVDIVGDDTTIILVTARTKKSAYKDLNDSYKEAAEKYDNVEVADWSAAVKGKEDKYFTSDDEHPSDYTLWVDTIYEAFPSDCSAGLLPGDTNQEKIWNYFVKSNLGLNAAAISGILGNLEQESGCNPFAVTGIYYGLYQTDSSGLKKAIDDAGLGKYWGSSNAPDDAVEKAIEIELDYLTKKNERFYKSDWSFMKNLKKVEDTPEGYSDLFVVAVEGAVTDKKTSQYTGDSNYIKDSGARSIGTKYFGNNSGGGKYYQEAGTRRKKAKKFYKKYANQSSSSSTSDSDEDDDNTTTTTTSSSVKWKDGWIVSGMGGYKKKATTAGETNFTTKSPKTGKVGPNKILLHATEGQKLGEKNKISEVYGSGESTTAHFTIDMKDRVVWQHHPITKSSGAIKSHDDTAGVQIEIVGFDEDQYKNEDYYLPNKSNFSDEDWDYLAKLLIAISDETGIPLTSSVSGWSGDSSVRMTSASEFKNYTGILGHMHAPDNDHNDPMGIWDYVEAAIERGGGDNELTDECDGGDSVLGGTIAEVAETLSSYKGTYVWGGGHGSLNSLKTKIKHKFKGSNYGVDCSGFARAVIYAATGIDIGGHTASEYGDEKYFDSVSKDDVQPGDFGYNDHHVVVVISEVDKDGNFTSAEAMGSSYGIVQGNRNINEYSFSRFKGSS